ncbi:COX15/CtaA family protein [uncultured Microbulbifer sp.]|uniref:COX15/CtaA family protein n=1 Tax=uncultured Microbulbifer sp. TaxID=348147 RepID=UPI00260FE91E|nr:COX15/CtaA family protein [uncultured Microbulbifer sp.]
MKMNSLQKINFRYGWRYRLALSGCALAVVVVVLGAFTRLVDAGLGCPDWPGCYGHLTWPNEIHEIQTANKAFPDAPVDANKTWPEMVHRYFAGVLLLLVAALAFLSWSWTKQPTFKHIHFLLALIILQAAFGMWTVTLKLWPQVVTAHLLGGMATLSMLWLLVERMRYEGSRRYLNKYLALSNLRPLAFLTALLIIVQIALGGWTSSNYAALACPDFPTCHGQWFPQANFDTGFNISQQIGPNYLGGALENDARTAIHLTHRFGAVLVTILMLILVFYTWRAGARRWALLLSSLLLLQVGLGIANVVMFLPLPIAVAHNAGAALLLLGIITFCYRIHVAKKMKARERSLKKLTNSSESVLVSNL